MINITFDVLGAYYKKADLIRYRGKEEDKVLVHTSLENVIWLSLLALLFHAISITGSALYLASLIPQAFETIARLAQIELSHHFRENQFVYAIVLGAVGSGILEFATVRVFASMGKNFTMKFLALSLAIFQVYTMYAGIKNTIVEYSVDKAIIQNIKTYQEDYKIADNKVRILQDKLKSILQNDKIAQADREVVANRAKLQVLNETLAFEQQNLKEALGALNVWKQNIAKKYGYEDFEVFRNDYRSRYPVWENKQIQKLGIPKIKRRIEKLNKEILLAQKATIAKTKSEVVKDYEQQIKEAKTQRDKIFQKIETMQRALRIKKEKVASWVDAHKKYFLSFGLFVIFVQALIAVAINKEKRYSYRKIEDIKAAHRQNEYAREYRKRKREQEQSNNISTVETEEQDEDEIKEYNLVSSPVDFSDAEVAKVMQRATEKGIYDIEADEARYLIFSYRYFVENNSYPSKKDINRALGFSNRKIAEIRETLRNNDLLISSINSSSLTSKALELLN